MAIKCVNVASGERDRVDDSVVGPPQIWFLMLFFQVDRQSPDTGGKAMDLHTYWKPQILSLSSLSQTPQRMISPKKGSVDTKDVLQSVQAIARMR